MISSDRHRVQDSVTHSAINETLEHFASFLVGEERIRALTGV